LDGVNLQAKGIIYVHLGEYGIPSEIRKSEKAMEWFVDNVRPKIQKSIFDGLEQPVCFMCMESDIDRLSIW
jgi:hypothetical protein